MDISDFRRILAAFADAPTNIDLSKGRLVVQLREDELIEAAVSSRGGMLYVTQDGEEATAEIWIVKYIARLHFLADRLLSYLPNEGHFVRPGGELLDELDRSPDEKEIQVPDAMQSAFEILNRRPGGTSTVLYLTSDAGEGKTTLINQMALAQAQAYKEKKTDWLLLPVSLGGRPFLRFDDVVVGTLMNRFRFQLLYFEALVELVRMGFIVLALDGFEEMFIERASGDAVSALGSLMQTLRSSGSVLIAARKAYFEYRSLQTQSRLFDALGNGSVSFARLALHRWDRRMFLEYCDKRGVSEGEQIYDTISAKLTPRHSLLTRAVLVKKLIDVVELAKDRQALLEKLASGTTEDYFREFVRTIIEREVHEKWINKKGDPPQPLLSVAEHVELLSLVAQEMWTNGTEVLSAEMLGVVAELFCEGRGKPVEVNRQVVERIKDHALIVQGDGAKDAFAFDHEEFFQYFLGEGLGRLVAVTNMAELRDMLRKGPLPNRTLDVGVHSTNRLNPDMKALVTVLNAASRSEGPASFTRENAGGLVVRLLDKVPGDGVVIDTMTFPSDALKGRELRGAVLRKCYFQPTSLDGTSLVNCQFESCDFERLEFAAATKIENVRLANSKCQCVLPWGSDSLVYDPGHIHSLLVRAKFVLVTDQGQPEVAVAEAGEMEEELVVAERAFKVFLRSTYVTDNTFRGKMGEKGPTFFSKVLPALEKAGIVREVTYTGGGKQRSFRLSTQFHVLSEALRGCGGRFDAFLRLVKDSQG